MSRISGICSATLFAIAVAGSPVTSQAQQPTAKLHGHVSNPAGMAVTKGEVRLTTDKSNANAKFDYTFPLDATGNFQGADIKPGSYRGVVFTDGKSVDFMDATLAPGEDKVLNFDMTRKEYMDKLSPEERAQIEEFKKNAAATLAANAKIANLNGLLTQARSDISAGKFDTALKAMSDATTQKPDEPLLWMELGNAQMGMADTAAKSKDASANEKYAAAQASFEKVVDLSSKAAKPKTDLIAAADAQLGLALIKQGKGKDAGAAFDNAAKNDPTKAGTYYYNGAATLFNSNQMDDAAAMADKAVAADPMKADAYYIKGQALIQKATVDPKTQKIVAPPDCIAAYQKYLEVAPNGPHAEEIKGILQGMGETIKSTYKAPAGKK